ncbi:hypothetical protein RhiJN_27461 [Ceratobasidium sp. AG-Ba]|nr:hypothetical protein RhiJN_13394 [Ceratobasidium sp. AG-Ba]QRV99442.1 hypothetical protein RhiJN_27461 [Ceratobasidium sp. AG-Ba]QRW13950.1 hypothetical protein RhiLY_12949 [Ceratobasidium sp. AG-Ba]
MYCSIRDTKRQQLVREIKKKGQHDYTTEQVKQAREKVEELVESTDNLPDVDIDSLIPRIDAVSKGTFNPGILNSGVIELLKSDTLMDTLRIDQNQGNELSSEAQDTTYEILDKENGVEFQKLSQWNDQAEMQTLNAVISQAAESMIVAMHMPLFIREIEEQAKKANNGMYVCQICKVLPKEERLGKFKKSTMTIDLFDKRIKWVNHVKSHSDWLKLVQYMITTSETEFKCPIEECDKRFKTVKETQEHCLEDCPQRETFQNLKKAYDERRRGDGTGPPQQKPQSLTSTNYDLTT